MGLFGLFARFFKSNSIPIFKSFFKAYKDTTAGPNPSSSSGSSGSSSGKKHPMDQWFKSILSKTNLSAPPLDKSTALKILNIELKENELDHKNVLNRYYVLYKKNDPANGGTSYLQSKVFVAKETLMSEFPNALELEQQFYKQVVEPEEKAEQQKKQAEKAEKTQKQQKAAKKQQQQQKK